MKKLLPHIGYFIYGTFVLFTITIFLTMVFLAGVMTFEFLSDLSNVSIALYVISAAFMVAAAYHLGKYLYNND